MDPPSQQGVLKQVLEQVLEVMTTPLNTKTALVVSSISPLPHRARTPIDLLC